MDIREIVEKEIIVSGRDNSNPYYFYFFSDGIGSRINSVNAVLSGIEHSEKNLHLIPELAKWFEKEPLSYFMLDIPNKFFEILSDDSDEAENFVVFSGNDMYYSLDAHCIKYVLNDWIEHPMVFFKEHIAACFKFGGPNCQAYLVDGGLITITKYGDRAICTDIEVPPELLLAFTG